MAELDRIKIESAVMDVEGAALLLDLAIEDLGQGIPRQGTGYTTFDLTRDQVIALHHARGLVYAAAKAARDAFYGTDEDEESASKA